MHPQTITALESQRKTRIMGTFKKLLNALTSWGMTVPEGHVLYEGEYHGGDLKCVCIETEEGRVFDGEFRFRRELGGGLYESAEGRFDNNLKTGTWKFKTKRSSRTSRLTVDFIGGHIAGNVECISEEMTMESSVVNAVIFQMNDGKVYGKIIGKIFNGEFEGGCDERCMADGLWSVIYEKGKDEPNKYERWDHGKLMESYEREGSKKRPTAARLRKQLNMLLSYDGQSLLNIVQRGTHDALPHIYQKQSE